MEDSEGVRDWLAQARRGVIELCVLALIDKTPHYGYELATALSLLGKPLAASEGTLYPLLRRLQRDGLVEATWQESRDGPPRKYYNLSPLGARLLRSQLAEWDQLTQAVADLRTQAVADLRTQAVADLRTQAVSDLRTHSTSDSLSATPEDEEVPDGSGSRRQPALP
jgi:PadR family transcriptional regulator